MGAKEQQSGAGLQESQLIRRPRRFQIILHNDDYTPATWVSSLLRSLFRKSAPEAYRLTMQVHREGSAVVGVYTHEIAETKCAQTLVLAQREGHPFQATMAPDDDQPDEP